MYNVQAASGRLCSQCVLWKLNVYMVKRWRHSTACWEWRPWNQTRQSLSKAVTWTLVRFQYIQACTVIRCQRGGECCAIPSRHKHSLWYNNRASNWNYHEGPIIRCTASQSNYCEGPGHLYLGVVNRGVQNMGPGLNVEPRGGLKHFVPQKLKRFRCAHA